MKTYQKIAITLSLTLSLLGCGGVGSDDTPIKDLPVALDDTQEITENAKETTIDVLTNDTPKAVLDKSTVEIITKPTNGTASEASTGEIKYKPNTGYYGTDTLKYTVKDKKGNFSNPATLTITITPNDAPVITITGDNPINIEVDSTYIDNVVTATDYQNTPVNVITTGSVNTNLLGEYILTYNATDSYGKSAEEKTRTVKVVDTTPPVITIKADNQTTIERTDTFNPLDSSVVTIADNYTYPNPPSLSFTSTPTFNVNTVGEYTITYTATDGSGNLAAEKSFSVKVISKTLTVTVPHSHKNCEGDGITYKGIDRDNDGVLNLTDSAANEVDPTLTVYDYGGKGKPISLTDLKNKINADEGIKSVNTCEITDMSSLFKDKTTFNQDISAWNVGSVNNMSNMFLRASAFNGDIGDWDVSSVTNMFGMFSQATSFNGTIDIWDVSSVTDMGRMFRQASSFTGGDMGNWDVSSVTNMSSMFWGTKLVDGNIGAWENKVKNVKEMNLMFVNTPFNANIGSWDVSSVTTMQNMFSGASDFEDGNIGAWEDKVKNVKDMSWMFNRASAFNGDIGSWDVSSVTTMRDMFHGASDFEDGNISAWEDKVKNVKDMSWMFNRASAFNGDIGNWDVSSVTDMRYMFERAIRFTGGNIGEWENNLGNWDNMSYMFYNATNFNADIGDWDMNSVKNMRGIFRGARSFTDGNIGKWENNLGNWDDMEQMFYTANLFNGDISNWNVASVTDMQWMFLNATAFNQDLGQWNISAVTTMDRMLEGATDFSGPNYDKLLIGWSNLPSLQTDVPFSVGQTQYGNGPGSAAKASILSNYNWAISDGGECVNCW
ncbi:MAG: BspA family leucine-rich repeat surface protein [Cocleimonas sp.]|nr:BspA family leucine-rich repeat surface protein [Cocleimonas sp.]